MRLHIKVLCGVGLLGMAFLTPGCVELYLIFGPGGIWGPNQGGVGGATTRPSVIPSPLFAISQIDPLLESAAGPIVVVPAQLNDDNGDGAINNGDLVDFVSGWRESQPVQIHINKGDGLSYATYTIAGGGPIARLTDIQINDFDGDGRFDIAVLVTDTGFVPVQGAALRGAVVLLFAPPDPADALAWQEVTISATFVLPNDDAGMTSFAIGDMNGDGRPDIVLGSNEVAAGAAPAKFIRVYLNPGPDPLGGPHLSRSGNAWIETTNPVSLDPVRVKSITLADIDGDGDLDIVASFPDAKTYNVRWIVNPLVPAGAAAVMAGSWTRRIVGQQGQINPNNPGGDIIAVGDIDGDGDFDVAAVHAGLGLVQWFRNPARPAEPGGFQIVTQQTFPWDVFNLVVVRTGFTINQFQLVHMDNDGLLDGFLTASGSMVGLQREANVESMWAAYIIASTDPVADIGRCAIIDVNRDGLNDIVAPLDRVGLTQDQLMLFRRLTP